MRYLIFLLASLFFAQAANAETYTWQVQDPNGNKWGVASTTVEQSCISATSQADAYSSATDLVFSAVEFIAVNQYYCRWSAKDSSGYSTNVRFVSYRSGDQCLPDHVYNPATGLCAPSPCMQKKDQPQAVKKSGIKGDGWLTVIYSERFKSNYYSYPSSACYQGCAVDIGRKLTCTLDTAHQYRCGGTGSYNGTSCSSEVPSSDPDPDGNEPVPQEKTSDEPCVYGTVNGVTSCVKRNSTSSEGIFTDSKGTGDCGSSAGGCTGSDPKSTEDKVETTITSENKPDGSTVTTKTDIKTTTKCVSSDTNCTTSTTTKVTVTTADASGVVTSTTGTCQGAHCTTNANPDADGDGFGDCVGDDCGDGEGEGASVVDGESCSVSLVCEGDAIQCAILRQEKENNCKWRLGAEEEAAIIASVSGEGFELEEKNIDGAALFNQAISQGRWLAASCPAPRSISVMGKTISFSWEPVCEFAIAMGPLIVALASLFFAVFVFRGVKGS